MNNDVTNEFINSVKESILNVYKIPHEYINTNDDDFAKSLKELYSPYVESVQNIQEEFNRNIEQIYLELTNKELESISDSNSTTFEEPSRADIPATYEDTIRHNIFKSNMYSKYNS